MIRLEELRVAAIVDEFTEYGLAKECNLLNLSFLNWQKQLEEFHPDLLFVESAWRGFNNQWLGQLSSNCSELKKIIDWCRGHGILNVFWNKEDPVHFFTFLSCASYFDWVYTTDLESIPMYKKLLGHDQVGLFPFAISTEAYQPVEITKRKNEVCFAGTYYRSRKKRCESFEHLYTNISQCMKLSIYNRNAHPNDMDYQFPDRYKDMILGTLPVHRIEEAYKGYRFGLTMNTVVTSSTMLARRIFELMASNTVVISNECRAVSMMFGELVLQEQDPKLVDKLRKLSEDEFLYRKIRLLALRKIMLEHTYQNRFRYLIAEVMKDEVQEIEYGVCIVSFVRNQMEADWVCASYQRQSYEKIRCILITDCEIQVLAGIETIERRSLERLDSVSNCDFYTYLSANNYYGTNYIRDMVLALAYSEVPIVGKGGYYQYINQEIVWKEEVSEYRYGFGIYLDRCIFSREYASRILIQQLEQTDGRYRLESRYLSTDGFHFCEGLTDTSCEYVEDIKIPTGCSIYELYQLARKKSADESRFEFYAEADDLLENLSFGQHSISRRVINGYLQLQNQKRVGTCIYLTDFRMHPIHILKNRTRVKIFFSCKGNQNVRLLFICMDSSGRTIKFYLILCNQLTKISIPNEVSYFSYRIAMEDINLLEIKGIYINPILSYEYNA